MRFPSHALAVLATAVLAVPVAASTSAFAAAASPSPSPSPSPSASPSPTPTPSQTPAATPSPSASATPSPSATPSTTAKATKTPRPKTVPKDAVEVTVKKIVDGDALDVVTASGRTVRIGLLEADAPEKGDCWYEGAVARLKALLPVGKPAYVRASEQVTENDRVLVYTWSPKGLYVNGDMVRSGFAQAVPYLPDHSYTDWQFAEQMRAQADGRGMWSGPCWAADTYDKRGSIQVPPGSSGDLAVEPADGASPAPGASASPDPDGLTGGTTTPTPTPTPTATPTPTPTPTATGDDDGSTDPRFGTCEEANRAGYGPYVRGIDVEYDWYVDSDSDGVVCET
ncbi:hypothetical protein DI270_026455 [Microbispora triticiradicis]|uniref:TNase-like domain-containing protein n=3 Tax=Microbispora TaxID=2005 RepID=A0ABY3M649_9ACTN|nr:MULTISPECIES: excalibur calcium-binding domain-containing protein [Microbispora]RGA02027.1 hypothetical protein DI270_026455 [Microbispora triticiradicis]TLP66398.1 hypothetical protein FED44_02645 [Microbispora fusca]TYB68182.1 hypothetical protein FXF59_01385 [Microbispora tritici]GLW23902.1 hypothetical protein Mame01_39450 [Microbispora amethystogenes]